MVSAQHFINEDPAVIENHRKSDVDDLLTKMMPPSVFASVGLLTLLINKSSLFLSNCSIALQQTFVQLLKITILLSLLDMNTYHTILNSGDNNYSCCSA